MTLKEFKIQEALGSLPYNIKIKLAGGRKTSKKILTKLSIDGHWAVRGYVARNPDTPIKVLKKLSTDKDSSVRYWVASNPNTPIEVLKKLSKDEHWDVRTRVARNSKIV